MRPLEGLQVVAVEQAVAAPFASSRLADAGAHVVKVERPEGDFARGYDAVARGQSSYFVWLNRGKESRSLDLASAEGHAALETLIAGADVLIQNLKPGALARLGFDPARLVQDYPRLITCSISGYGETGPMADRKAYDLLIQAESGLCSITGGPSEPSRVGLSVVDIATGATAHAAILEALIRRGITGRGAQISVSMFDVLAEWLTVPLLNHEGGHPPRRVGLAHPSIAPYGVFQPRTGAPILISIQSDREWRRLCADFIGDAALGTDPRFATNVARVQNRGETDALVAAAFARHDAADAVARLAAADIALATVNDMAGLSAHPHLRRITVDSPNGPVSFPAPGAVFVGEPRSYGPVPALAPPLLLGLIGDNIAASRAPRLHQLAGRQAGVAVRYDRLVPRALQRDFEAVFDMARTGGYRGLNITYPYKERVTALVDVVDPRVRAIGAVNTVIFGDGRPTAHNTDFTGFVAAYRGARGDRPPGRVLMIGTGGVGRAVAFGLVDLGVAELRLVDRDLAKARALAADLRAVAPDLPLVVGDDAAGAAVGVDGVINCTPVGMVGYPGTPLPAAAMPDTGWAFDAVYTPVDTGFVRDAGAAGLAVISGWELFFWQGVHAWALFSGLPLDAAALRAALQAAAD